MKKTVLLAVGLALVSSSAFAGGPSDAFIGQVGNGHDAANIQLEQTSGSTGGNWNAAPASKAVILQTQGNPPSGNGHTALQVQQGPGNNAYTYQASNYADDSALTWQDGTGNTSVTVQASSADGSTEEEFSSRIIQNGNNNVAFNWQSDASAAGNPTVTLNPSLPSLNLQGDNVNVAGHTASADVNDPGYTFGFN